MTGAILFLTLNEVEDMHADQIREFGGSMGVRNLDGLKSAIAQPEAMFGGEYLHQGDLFADEPDQWGLRGDPYLWRELRDYLAGRPLPSTAAMFAAGLDDALLRLTGHQLSAGTAVFVARLGHGGMSSGMVSGKFWREHAVPMLVKRFEQSRLGR
jgi:hypothetical protein